MDKLQFEQGQNCEDNAVLLTRRNTFDRQCGRPCWAKVNSLSQKWHSVLFEKDRSILNGGGELSLREIMLIPSIK